MEDLEKEEGGTIEMLTPSPSTPPPLLHHPSNKVLLENMFAWFGFSRPLSICQVSLHA